MNSTDGVAVDFTVESEFNLKIQESCAFHESKEILSL
jgi:hypothetical protein